MIQPQSSILKRKRGNASLTIFVKPDDGGSEVKMMTEGRGFSNAKAKAQLGWEPKVDFTGLVKMMVDADLARVAAEPRPGVRPAAV